MLSLGDSFEPGEQLSVDEAESGREAVPDAVVGGAGQGVHEADSSICHSDPSTVPSVDLTGVQLALVETASQWPHTARASVSGIIPDPELPQDPTSAHAEAAQRRTIEELLVGPDSPGLKTLRPVFHRLAPPLFLRNDEIIWQDPVDLSHITYE